MTATAEEIERLLDAIELLKANQRAEARAILRGVIQSNSDFEDAWLWMSLAVDTLDQSAVCLDNALRINPGNNRALEALMRLRATDIVAAERRGRLKLYRDLAAVTLWLLVVVSLCAALTTLGMVPGRFGPAG
ncbi:MAG: hypothetical protein IPM16_08800 [Chloroflexi bacterium]|nr:hypothetical protein [Chloroflexota bacterium]